MNQRLFIALLTGLGFAAGFGARMLTESGPAIPPAPALGTEFVRSSTPAPAPENKERHAPTYTEKDRARLISDITKIRPQIDHYRNTIDEIGADFERDLLPIFSPEQREKYLAKQKRDLEGREKGRQIVAQTPTLSDEQIFFLQQRPLWNALWNVAINWRLEKLVRDYKLDEPQQATVRVLLQKRRERFLALVDSTPPPSITLSELAPQSEKIGSGTPEAKPADAKK